MLRILEVLVISMRSRTQFPRALASIRSVKIDGTMAQ